MFDSLDTLPIKVYYKALETENYHLLNPNAEVVEDSILEDLWEDLKEEFQSLDNNELNNKIFKLSKNYDYYILTYEMVLMCVESLAFRYDEELIQILKTKGYRVRKESYEKDLENIKRFADGLLTKANHFKSQLPKEDNPEERKKDKTTIDDIIASYELILGYGFGDYNTMVCTKFLAVKKQVENKIKQQEKQLRELKNNKKR